jgi:hypothetical protein
VAIAGKWVRANASSAPATSDLPGKSVAKSRPGLWLAILCDDSTGFMMKKVGVVVFAVVVLIAVIVLGYHKYVEIQELSETSKVMRDASVRVSTLLEYMRGGHGVTYTEFIQQAREHNSAITQSIITIKGRRTPQSPENLNHAVWYLEKVQEVIRASERTTLAIIEATAAKRSAEAALAQLNAFVANPGDGKARINATSLDPDSISKRLAIASADFEITTLQLQQAMLDLSEAKPPAKSSIPADVYLSKNDLRDITLKIK